MPSRLDGRRAARARGRARRGDAGAGRAADGVLTATVGHWLRRARSVRSTCASSPRRRHGRSRWRRGAGALVDERPRARGPAPRPATDQVARRPRRASPGGSRGSRRPVRRRGDAVVPHVVRPRLPLDGPDAPASRHRPGPGHVARARPAPRPSYRPGGRGGARQDPARAARRGARAGDGGVGSTGMVLPPVYYGTVDATPLWVVLLHDAWRAGLADAEVEELLPGARGGARLDPGAAGRARLPHLRRHGRRRAGQPGLEGLADRRTVRRRPHRGGADRAVRGAGVRRRGTAGRRGPARRVRLPGGTGHRDAAEGSPSGSAGSSGSRTHRGPFPAIALDGTGTPVDTLTSNIGHLLGTGLLDLRGGGPGRRSAAGPQLGLRAADPRRHRHRLRPAELPLRIGVDPRHRHRDPRPGPLRRGTRGRSTSCPRACSPPRRPSTGRSPSCTAVSPPPTDLRSRTRPRAARRPGPPHRPSPFSPLSGTCEHSAVATTYQVRHSHRASR